MPEVEIILQLKPNEKDSLNALDYPLGFLEKFAQVLKIQMQFEQTAEGILAFFKTRADLEQVLEFISQVINKVDPAIPLSGNQHSWECVIVKSGTEDRITLLKHLQNKIQAFLGRFGLIELCDEKVIINIPENFRLHPYFQSVAFGQDKSDFPKKSGKQ